MLVTGFAALFVLPGIILILFLIGIGSNSATLLILLYVIAAFCSVTFTGMTLAKTLLPRFTDNKALNNEWICSLIGACVFFILRKIPVLGWIILAASLMYTFGYFIQSVYLRLKGNKPRKIKGDLNAAPQEDTLEPVEAIQEAEPEISIIDAAAENNEPEEIPAAEEPEPEAEAEDPKDPEETSAS
jgi:chromate transport protein ChrA